jgi:hypothetical protein
MLSLRGFNLSLSTSSISITDISRPSLLGLVVVLLGLGVVIESSAVVAVVVVVAAAAAAAAARSS